MPPEAQRAAGTATKKFQDLWRKRRRQLAKGDEAGEVDVQKENDYIPKRCKAAVPPKSIASVVTRLSGAATQGAAMEDVKPHSDTPMPAETDKGLADLFDRLKELGESEIAETLKKKHEKPAAGDEDDSAISPEKGLQDAKAYCETCENRLQATRDHIEMLEAQLQKARMVESERAAQLEVAEKTKLQFYSQVGRNLKAPAAEFPIVDAQPAGGRALETIAGIAAQMNQMLTAETEQTSAAMQFQNLVAQLMATVAGSVAGTAAAVPLTEVSATARTSPPRGRAKGKSREAERGTSRSPRRRTGPDETSWEQAGLSGDSDA